LVLEAVSLENYLARVDAALARLDTLARSSDRPERWLAARGDVLLEAGRHLEAGVADTAALDAVRGGARRRAHTAAAARLKLHIAERLVAGTERSSRKR
jgi:hypothetical protein